MFDNFDLPPLKDNRRENRNEYDEDRLNDDNDRPEETIVRHWTGLRIAFTRIDRRFAHGFIRF